MSIPGSAGNREILTSRLDTFAAGTLFAPPLERKRLDGTRHHECCLSEPITSIST